MFNKAQVEESALAIGTFIGLLNSEASHKYSVNTDFFKDPSNSMEKCGERISDLIDLIYVVLGDPVDNPPQPPVFENANWLMLPNPKTDGKTPFYLVLPAQKDGKAPADGEIGIGTLATATLENLSFEVYISIPFFKYSATSGATFLLDQPNASARIGLNITNTSGNFKSGSTSFTGIDVHADIFFSATVPTFQLEFLDLKGTNAPSTYTTFSSLLGDNVTNWLGDIVLQTTSVTNWLNKEIGKSTVTPGDLLVAVGFLSKNSGSVVKVHKTLRDQFAPVLEAGATETYALAYQKLKSETPLEIAENFVFHMLDTLAANGPKNPLVDLPGGGVFVVSRDGAKGGKDYGLGMETLLSITQGKNGKPSVDFSVGAWLSGEDEDNNWMKRSYPSKDGDIPPQGLAVWLINHTTSGAAAASSDTISFSPDFTLCSVGVNIDGSAQKPLFSIDGYTLKGAELRATLNPVTLATPSSWTYGFATKLDQIGIPLTPAAAEGGSGSASDNPVAKSLLQSKGDNSGGSDAPGDQAAVNPTFGAAVAWYLASEVNLQLYDSDDKATDKPVIISINRQLGPLLCEKIGIGWVQSKHILSVLFDGSVKLGPLEVSLEGLTVGIPVTTPTEIKSYSLDLEGLGIEFKAGDVSLDAAFAKIPPSQPDHPYTEYDGTAAIKAGTFALSALGAYAYIPPPSGSHTSGFTSLFIFGLFIEPLGGPEFFFVTGLAAGFGYNRGINLPDQNSVPDFPFVGLLNDPTKYGSLDDPTALLGKIDSYVPPERGEYWFAAGVRFNSFDLINTSALLSVEFGHELEIAILGLSWMSLPPPPTPGGTPPDTKFAYAELGIDIQILPSQGVVMATAILTPNSYVIDPDCHLTGGFAFYVWFGDNPHSGQFVLTIGGYNPHFKAPSYYPKVPRLGISWNVSKTVTISGNAYFALTSSAIMAGGGLSIVFASGNLKAWFKAQMDALVQWAPFQYSLDISISIGVSYKLDLLFTSVTLKVELGASIDIWGPRMGGKAKITWFIISFTVPFGADLPTSTPTLEWTTSDGQGFADTLLPNQKPKSSSDFAARELEMMEALELDSTPAPKLDILKITAVSGVTGYTGPDKGIWIVRPSTFAFSALTTFPTTELTVTPASSESPAPTPWKANGYNSIDVRPMNGSVKSSVLNVELKDEDTGKVYSLFTDFNFTLKTSSVPAAKWGPPIPAKPNKMPGTPEMNKLLPGYLMGFQSVSPKKTVLTPSGADALKIDSTTAFTDIVVDKKDTKYLPLLASTQPSGPVPQVSSGVIGSISSALKSSTVTSARTAVFNTLIADFGIDPLTNDDLSASAFAADPGAYLNGDPLILPAS